jgi:hypothetical protein
MRHPVSNVCTNRRSTVIGASVISVDLGWKLDASDRAAVAFVSREGVRVRQISGTDENLIQFIAEVGKPGALVLLDVPLDGCDDLNTDRPRRSVDFRLAKIGVPILPSIRAGDRGTVLRRRLFDARADLRVEESYPYAVLRVLWALDRLGQSYRHDTGTDVDFSPVWWQWPPKYKRARRVIDRLEATQQVAELLVGIEGFAEAVPDCSTLNGSQLYGGWLTNWMLCSV